MSTESLFKKTVLIVGGSSGIGYATAIAATAAGANVIITSRSLQRVKEAAVRIGRGTQAMELDVNMEQTITALFASIDSVDHIYIAAGSTKTGSLLDNTLEDSLQAFHERVVGSLRIVKAAIPKLNQGGSIVFTGGISTDRPIKGAWVSGIGTAAAEQLARVLVMEYPHIRFNAISPGYTNTPMWDTVLGADKDIILSNIANTLPTKKIASAKEVAEAVIFLMGNSAITGEVLHIDGGGRLV